MSDARDQTGAGEAPVNDATPATPGDWLRQERERQGASVQRIAADMHLSTTVIEAIEHDRFSSLGAPVFAKGHLRKYASLLGLPIDRIFELYEKLEDAPREVDPVPLTQRTAEPALRPVIRDMQSSTSESGPRRVSIAFWIGSFLVVVIVVLIAWWVLGRRPTTERTGRQEAATPTSIMQAASNKPLSESQSPAAASTPNTVATNATVSASQTTTKPAHPTAAPPPGKLRIRLIFARDSWAEVSDAAGKQMWSGVGRADFQQTVDVE